MSSSMQSFEDVRDHLVIFDLRVEVGALECQAFP